MRNPKADPNEVYYITYKNNVLFYDIDMKDCKMPAQHELIFIPSTRIVFFHDPDTAAEVASQWEKGQVKACIL